MGSKEKDKEKIEMNVADGTTAGGRDLERLIIPISTTPSIPDHHPLFPAPTTILNGGSELSSPSASPVSSSQRHSGKEVCSFPTHNCL